MADRLYLSLWYPNFRLEALPSALIGVMRQFAMVGGKRVSAASAYPISFSEPPTYQRVYIDPNPIRLDPEDNPMGTIPSPIDDPDSAIETAVAEATEQLHDDMAYEFEMRWQLWTLERRNPTYNRHRTPSIVDQDAEDEEDVESYPPADQLDVPGSPWHLRPHTVRILGFGPQFDMAGFEQNGHLLVDFGLDTPWIFDHLADPVTDPALDASAQKHIQQNVEKLLAFTLLIEKHCGISSRLLWTESGEPLAEKLIARLQRVN